MGAPGAASLLIGHSEDAKQTLELLASESPLHKYSTEARTMLFVWKPSSSKQEDVSQ